MKYIKRFDEINLKDVSLVGGKTASLGELTQLADKHIRVPQGFAITADAYWYFLEHNHLKDQINELKNKITDYNNIREIETIAQHIRSIIIHGIIPDDLKAEIEQGYKDLCQLYKKRNLDVAVRSSATAEDLPQASFAGQQETYLGIRGSEHLLEACKKCFASLFTARALSYRQERGFDHFAIALTIAVQKMVRSDKATSGVAFTLDTESGFKDVVVINASYGLGETIVQGKTSPDEYVVHKPTLKLGFQPIIKKIIGSKEVKMIYGKQQLLKSVRIAKKDQRKYCLSDEHILEIARCATVIEDHYSSLHQKWTPMDIEWAQDGGDGLIYIVQARPETVHAIEQKNSIKRYSIKDGNASLHTIVIGQSIGQQIVSGVARVITSLAEIDQVQKGDILVTRMTDPDWVPAMRKAVGIVTDEGGRTCHAAIVSREMNIPAVIGTNVATKKIKDGAFITLDCSQGSTGYVYESKQEIEVHEIFLEKIPKSPVSILMNLADPDRSFSLSFLPVDGIGLARIEFIISSHIKVHPMALLHFDKIQDKKVKKQIEIITSAYKNKKQFYIDELAYGISTIAAAFYPKPVTVRFSDFKSNEYRDLLGGIYFEPREENPMLGLRGASRYYNEHFKEAFFLECQAVKKVITDMGLTNVQLMVPFVRTVDEGKKVIALLQEQAITHDKVPVIMMCEIPSNVLLIDEFSAVFDGFSIGSNDLAQLTLGVDRDSGLLSKQFDERDPAVMKFLGMAVDGAKRNNKYISICGQAPSDYPEIAEFLIKHGIDALSLNPDSVIPFLMSINKK